MNAYKVFNTINGRMGYCGTYYAATPVGACVAHIRKCGGHGKLGSIPSGYKVELVENGDKPID